MPATAAALRPSIALAAPAFTTSGFAASGPYTSAIKQHKNWPNCRSDITDIQNRRARIAQGSPIFPADVMETMDRYRSTSGPQNYKSREFIRCETALPKLVP